MSTSQRLSIYAPLHARNLTIGRSSTRWAFDAVTFVVVRHGSAHAKGHFGSWTITKGDVLALSSLTRACIEPQRRIIVSLLQIDPHFLVDQMFWHYADALADRYEASRLLKVRYPQPAQLLRLDERGIRSVEAWLDELIELLAADAAGIHFYRAQGLVLHIIDVLLPHLRTADDSLAIGRPSSASLALPRSRSFSPLRPEAHMAARLLRERPDRQWNLNDLAAAVHLSVSQLGRIFTSAFGRPPIAYLARVRVVRMAALLRETDLPIRAIGRQVGWRDPDHASRQFRRHFGVSPRRYRADTAGPAT